MRRWLLLAGLLCATGLGMRAPAAHAAQWRLRNHVVVDQPVDGTLLAAGSDITIAAPVAGTALLTGSRVMVNAAIGKDLVAAAGRVAISAPVNGDAVLLGGDVLVSRGAVIAGDAKVYAGAVEMNGTVSGNLTLKGGDLTLGGTVMGDVDAASGHLALRPGAHIMGNVRFSGPDALDLPPGAAIDGQVSYVGSLPHSRHAMAPDDSQGSHWSWFWRMPSATMVPGLHSHWNWGWGGLSLGAGLVKGLGTFLFGMMLYLLFPGLVRDTAARIAQGPSLSVIVGLGAVVLLPALMLLLCLTVVGIPVALVTLLAYLASLLVATPLATFGLCDWAVSRRHGPPVSPGQRIRRYAGMVAALTLLGALPMIGGVLSPLMVLMGFGGLARHLSRRTPGMGY